MSVADILAVAGALTPVVAGIGTAVVLVLNTLAKNREAKAQADAERRAQAAQRKAEEAKTDDVRRGGTIAEWKDIAEELKRQLKAAISQIENKQAIIDEVVDERGGCEVAYEGLWAWANSVDHALRISGDHPEILPLPPKVDVSSARAKYLQRKSEQNTQIAVAAAKSVINNTPVVSPLQ